MKGKYWTLGAAVCEHIGLNPDFVQSLRLEFRSDGTARVEAYMYEPRVFEWGGGTLKRYHLVEDEEE